MPGYACNGLNKDTLIKHYKFGLRDIEFAEDEELSIWLAADAGVMNTFKNLMSFSFLMKNNDDTMTEGVIEGYTITPDKDCEHNYKVTNLFKVKCESAAICIKWYQSQKMFIVGYESGHIGLYSYDPDKDMKAVKEIENTKIHNKRVLVVEMDPEAKLVYSISKGNKMLVYNYSKKMILNGIPSLTQKLLFQVKACL